jgi:NADH-quinone oxidoreductase subunit J
MILHTTFQEGLFFVLASIAVLSAIMVVLLTNPVRCVLSLVLTFIATSGLWLLAHAEFLGLILVLVYVGAVMTLFLFVVMMLNTDKNSGKRYLMRYIPFGLIIVALFVALLLLATEPEHFGTLPADVVSKISNTESLGLQLYTTYAYPLEIAAVLLLIAIISAIILAHRPPRNSRVQQVFDQLAVRKEDRLSVVKISADSIAKSKSEKDI